MNQKSPAEATYYPPRKLSHPTVDITGTQATPRLEHPKYEQQLQRRIKEATKRLIKKERRRAMYRAIGCCLTPTTTNSGGISRVDIPHVAENKGETVDPKTWKGP